MDTFESRTVNIFESLKQQRKHSSIEEEQWLFISNDEGLYAIDCAAPGIINLAMTDGSYATSIASAKHLGLVALLMPNGNVSVGNPITGVWESIQLRKVSFKLVGISIASASCASFKLCCLYQSGTSSLCTMVYSSRSRQWTEGASFSCDNILREHRSWNCTTDGEKMYAWCIDYPQFSIVSYDIRKNEWETMALGLPFRHGEWMSFHCNHGDNYPTMVVCNRVAYWVGRDSSHAFLKVYCLDQVAQTFELVGELQTCCSNCTIKYASDGAAHIYVLRGMELLRFNLNSRRWRVYTLTEENGNTLWWFPVKCMAVVTLAGGEMPVPVDISRSGSNKLLHLVLSGPEASLTAPMGVAVNAEDKTDIVKLNRSPCPSCNSGNPSLSWVAATLEELGLFCVLHEHVCRRTQIRRMVCFPDSILVGNPLDTLERAVETVLGRVLPQHLVGLICKMTNEDLSQGCYREIPMFEMDHMEEAKEEQHNDKYDAELYANEFVGVAMARHPTSTHDYLVCCFYRRKRIIHSQVYDSTSKQWKQGATQEVEGEWDVRHKGIEVFPYGWRCDFTTRDGKAYVYSSELCYSVGLYRKHLLRLFTYDILGDKWEVVVKNMEFPQHMLQTWRKGRGMTLVECCEQLFVVAKVELGIYVEVRKLDLEHKELKLVAVLEARGEICATSDNDKGKIFVSSSEPESSLHKSRVMAYDVHADEWSVLPVDHPNGGVYHMVMAELKQPEYI